MPADSAVVQSIPTDLAIEAWKPALFNTTLYLTGTRPWSSMGLFRSDCEGTAFPKSVWISTHFLNGRTCWSAQVWDTCAMSTVLCSFLHRNAMFVSPSLLKRDIKVDGSQREKARH